MRELNKSLDAAEASAAPKQVAMLEKVRDSLKEYLPGLEKTVSLARKAAASLNGAENDNELLQALKASRLGIEHLRDAAQVYVTYADDHVTHAAETAAKTAEFDMMLVIGVAAGGIALGLVLGFLIAQNGIVKPLQKIVHCLKSLADGNLDVEVFGTDRKDEVGTVAATTLVFQENMVANKQMEADAKAAETRSAQERRAAMLKLADEFEASVGGVVSAVSSAATEMQASAQSLTSIAEETTAQTSAVAAATDQANANMQTVAAAAEELSSSINEINRQISTASRQAGEAASEATETSAVMESLRQNVSKIGDVIVLIQDIAEQTNLLALNATIEAARAGEAGKGFAVVASEVKSLAQQTSKATEDIDGQITQMQKTANEAIEAVERIADQITKINSGSSAVAAAAEEQGSATSEIARNVQEAATGTRHVSENIGGVTTAASETGRMSSDVLSASTELSQQSERLRQEVDSFLARVRAA